MLWKTSLRQFSKEAKFRISLDQQSKVITEVRAIKNISNLRCGPLVFTPNKAFSKTKQNKKNKHTHIKTKRDLSLVFLHHFLHDF